jgi:hypothetical protein
MLLVKTRSGFEVVADPTRASGRDFARDVLGYLRASGIEFVIGGYDPGVIMTIHESSERTCDDLARWWHARASLR